MKPILILVVLLAAASIPLMANRVDVTNNTSVWVHTGAYLEFQFGIWNYGKDNPGYSPYPEQIGLQVAGLDVSKYLDPALGYYPELAVEGWIYSLDGTVDIPLGTLFVTPGTFETGSGDSIGVGVVSTTLYLTDAQSQRLFGNNIGNYSSAATVRLRNVGEGFTLGVSPDYTVHNWISEPGVSGDGPVQTGGITGKVTLANPEPGTFLLLGGALILLGVVFRRWPSTRPRN